MNTEETIRKAYAAFVGRDRGTFEELLSDDFAFTSPLDDRIDKAAYFKRCWPGGDRFADFEIEKLFAKDDEAFIRYEITLKNGSRFRNTELIRVENGKIKEVEVYFGTESDSAKAEQIIRQLIADREKAVKDKDAAKAASLYTEDAIIFGLAPPLLTKGVEKKFVQGWFDTFRGPIAYEITDLQLDVGDELAVTRSLNHIGGTKVGGGEKSDTWVRETLGLRKIDGAWKIAHEHTSVPFYMDGSVKAAVDLKPQDR